MLALNILILLFHNTEINFGETVCLQMQSECFAGQGHLPPESAEMMLRDVDPPSLTS